MLGQKGSQLRLLCFITIATLTVARVDAQANFKTGNGYKAEPLNLPQAPAWSPRSVVIDEVGDVLVLARGTSQIFAIFQSNGATQTASIVEGKGLGLNHGLAYKNGFLYASSRQAVYRWPYRAGQRQPVSPSEPEVVVKDIPGSPDDMHLTRSLIVDDNGRLYVTIGSSKDVEESLERSLIRRFDLSKLPEEDGFRFGDGEIFAKGLRNTVGLTFDSHNNLWGVDCGADNLIRDDLGPSIQQTNPADELLKFDQQASGVHYGYPYCWTVGELKGHHVREQLSWPGFGREDAWCKNAANNHPPVAALPAHNAPLGLTFYDGRGCNSSESSFPCSMKGDLFIAFHGSNSKRPTASGFKVARLPIHPQTGHPTGEIQDVIFDPSPNSCELNPTTCLRPVDLVFDLQGHLILSSDSSSQMFKVTYDKSNDSVYDKIKEKALHWPGLVALVAIAFVTVGVVGLLAYKFCCGPCRGTKGVPYVRDQI